jgi:PTS system galactitol-specific IIB component
MSKRVLVACGSGIATSTHVAERIKELCRSNGIDVEVVQSRVQEIPTYADSVDLIVATTQVAVGQRVPVLNGIPFLTGVGEEEVEAEIVKVLKSTIEEELRR